MRTIKRFLQSSLHRFGLYDYVLSARKQYLISRMSRRGVYPIRLDELGECGSPEFFLPIWLCRSGSTPWYDLLVLSCLVKKHQPDVIFEIGSFEGLGSLVMCNNCSNSKLVTLDMPFDEVLETSVSQFALKDQSVGSEYRSGLLFDQIRTEVEIDHLYGDSWEFDFSPYHASVDFFFIDGSHTYRYVVKDTLNALRSIRRHGVIVWHDVRNGQVLEPILMTASCLTVYFIRNSNICFTAPIDDIGGAVRIMVQALEELDHHD